MAYKYVLVLLLVFLLVNPTESWSLRRSLKKLGRKIEKGVKKVGKNIKKVGCKALFGVVCPAAVGTAAVALGAGTSGAGAVAVGAGAAIGKHACHVRQKKCRREADAVLLPFSDEFTDYDTNEDKWISYEEFVFSVMKTVDMADASELEEPFLFADLNGDGGLDRQEFQAAPFLFAHVMRAGQETTEKTSESITSTTSLPEVRYVEATSDVNVTSLIQL